MIIIGITGTLGAGKGTIVDYLCKKRGFLHYSVREFLEEAFSYVGLNWKDYVRIDDMYKRPNEVPLLLGDASRMKKLGWKPKMKFKDIVRAMIDYDLEHTREFASPVLK